MIKVIQDFLAKRGLFLRVKPPKELRRRKLLLAHHKIDVVFDVGANIGQYAQELRNIGYQGLIHSYEPVKANFEKLEKACRHDDQWFAHHKALGSERSESEINISKNSWSSSIRNLLPSHSESEPSSQYVGKEVITIDTVSNEIEHLELTGKRIWLKVDTQGYESEVLAGAGSNMDECIVLQLELSFIPLYEDGLLWETAIPQLKQQGYELISVEPGFFDKNTGHLLQADGVFLRNAE
jgi:FkbM family methyltransferase